MSDVKIPEDVMQAADAAWNELAALNAPRRDPETQIIARAILAERERCAKIADEQVEREAYGHAKHTAVTIAQAIRSSHE